MNALQKQEKPASLTTYVNDYYNQMTAEYYFGWNEQLVGNGIRYLHYYKKENSILIANVINGQAIILDLTNGTFRKHQFHNSTIRKIGIVNGEIVTASWDGSVKVSDYATGKTRLTLTTAGMGRCPHYSVSDDGKYLFSFSYDSDKNPMAISNTVRKWSLKNGALLGSYAASDNQRGVHRSGSTVVVGNLLYVCSDSGFIKVFDLGTNQLINEASADCDFRMCCMFGKNYMIASDWSGFLHFYNIEQNRIDFKTRCHNADVYCLRFHPIQHDVIFASSYLGKIRVLRLPDLQLINVIDVNQYELWSMDFMDNLLLVGDSSGEIMVYDISDLNRISLKGRIVLFDQSFVVQLTKSKMFYASDLSVMEVYSAKEKLKVTGKEADYLLAHSNSRQVIHQLFGEAEALPDLFSTTKAYVPLLL